MKKNLTGFGLFSFTVSSYLAALFVVVCACCVSCKGQNSRFEKINKDLHSKDVSVRSKAISSLRELKPTVKEQELMLEEAAKPFPVSETSDKSIGALIIASAAENPDIMLVDIIGKNFARYDATGKHEALTYLSKVDNIKSIRLFTDLFTENAKEAYALPPGILEKNYRYKEIIFPRLLTISTQSHAYADVLLLLLSYLEAGELKPSSVQEQLPSIISYSTELRKKMNTRSGNKWDDPELYEIYNNAGIAADLLGHFDTPASKIELAEYLGQRDVKTKMFAAVSLLKLGQSISNALALEIAADAETRNWFYESLKAMNKTSIYPAQFKTQAYFAEGDMVNWLTYPAELGRVPDAIELMKTVEVDLPRQKDKAVFYLFRFKSDNESFREDGWMAGVAGYYLQSEMPTTTANGYTFSSFEKWDAKTPDQHVDEIRKLIDNANNGRN
ncbi:MAG: hypothetical protein DI535_14605 [Citrobacter freundii]|nr:MAG: hypothetical protein DI535_14605 [Citrobacter freundii]